MKKNFYAFLIKKHLCMLDYAQNRKLLATAKQLIRKNSICCLKNQAIFFMSTPFNKKNTFVCWTKLKTENLLATAKQLIRKNYICYLKNQAFFFTE